jgi:hypothetical protein
VRDDGKPVVENHSAYLTKNKARKVLIQGNTDERGGTEYNLALGQKRAEAVRKSMAPWACRMARWKPFRWAKKSRRQPATTKPPGLKTAAPTSSINNRCQLPP